MWEFTFIPIICDYSVGLSLGSSQRLMFITWLIMLVTQVWGNGKCTQLGIGRLSAGSRLGLTRSHQTSFMSLKCHLLRYSTQNSNPSPAYPFPGFPCLHSTSHYVVIARLPQETMSSMKTKAFMLTCLTAVPLAYHRHSINTCWINELAYL